MKNISEEFWILVGFGILLFLFFGLLLTLMNIFGKEELLIPDNLTCGVVNSPEYQVTNASIECKKIN